MRLNKRWTVALVNRDAEAVNSRWIVVLLRRKIADLHIVPLHTVASLLVSGRVPDDRADRLTLKIPVEEYNGHSDENLRDLTLRNAVVWSDTAIEDGMEVFLMRRGIVLTFGGQQEEGTH
jgi:hypothetical protein